MARGTQLQVLRKMARAESGMSTNVSQGANQVAQVNQVIQRTQETLWLNNEWEFLKIYSDESIVTGTGQTGRYYSFNSGITFENVTSVELLPSTGDSWRPVIYGIDAEHYNAISSDEGERRDHVLRWQFYNDGTGDQFEVWPMAASAGQTLRMHAKKDLSALIADTDTADLDDHLITLYAAAELLAMSNPDLAEAKLRSAERLLVNLQGRQRKSPMIIMGGGTSVPRFRGPRPYYGKKL